MEVKENIIIIPEQIIPKKTKKEYTYIASDGKTFSSKSECIKYESDLENNKIEKELYMQFIHINFDDDAELYCICTLRDSSDIKLLRKYFSKKCDSNRNTGVLYSDNFIPNRKYIVYITYYWNQDFGEYESNWNVELLSYWLETNLDLIKKYQQKLEMILQNNDSVDK